MSGRPRTPSDGEEGICTCSFFAILETEASRILRRIPGAIRVDLILRNPKEAVPMAASSMLAPWARDRPTRRAGRDRRAIHAVL